MEHDFLGHFSVLFFWTEFFQTEIHVPFLQSPYLIPVSGLHTTSFPGFCPTFPTERGRVGENPGNEGGLPSHYN